MFNKLNIFCALPFLFSCATASAAFPEDWVGNWSGKCQNLKAPGTPRANFRMDLNIAKLRNSDRYQWQIVYGGQNARNYELVQVNPAAGHYAVDEKNGVVLDSFIINDELVSSFSFNTQRLNTSVKISEDRQTLKYLITTYGGPLNTYEGSGISIAAYQFLTQQNCTLHRR